MFGDSARFAVSVLLRPQDPLNAVRLSVVPGQVRGKGVEGGGTDPEARLSLAPGEEYGAAYFHLHDIIHAQSSHGAEAHLLWCGAEVAATASVSFGFVYGEFGFGNSQQLQSAVPDTVMQDFSLMPRPQRKKAPPAEPDKPADDDAATLDSCFARVCVVGRHQQASRQRAVKGGAAKVEEFRKLYGSIGARAERVRLLRGMMVQAPPPLPPPKSVTVWNLGVDQTWAHG